MPDRQWFPAIAAGLVLLSGCTSASTPSPSATTTNIAKATASPTVEPTPTPEPTSIAMSWSVSRFDGQVAAATADMGGFVAVSSDPEQRLVWSSSNGQSWSNTTAPDPAPSGCDIEDIARCFPNTAGMGQLARLDDTLYSFGTACCFNDFFRPVGWRLTDGEAWDAIQSQSAFFGFGGVLDVAASDTALVVSTSYGLGATSRVWRWTSDTSWVETNLMASDRDLHSVNDIAWTGGSFLAVGTPDAYGDSLGPRVWSSSDGLTWTPATAPDDAAHLCSVSGTSAGFIVLGATDEGMAAWTASEVPGDWARTDLAGPPPEIRDPADLRESCGIVELDNGFLAFRAVTDGTLTWTSTDGATWEAGETLAIATGPDQVAAVGNTVVMFGQRADPPPDSGEIASRLFLGTLEP